MTLSRLKPRIQAYYPRGGPLALVVCLFLASASLAQLADTTIVFVSERDWDWPAEQDWNSEIYLMDPNGKQIRRLTEQPKSDFEPAWSPDGKQITFVSYRDLEQLPKGEIHRGEIYLMNADGTNLANLTQVPERAEGVSSWSPDGTQIAFTSAELFNADLLASSDIFVMDADGANRRNLTNHEALDETPDWSPDGNRIAFSSDRDGDWEIYVMNPDGTNPINLTNHPAKDGRPDWSPDGTRIAFTSNRDGNLEIYVMNADGTNPINLTNHPAEDNHSSWSPDGTRIAFDSLRDHERDYNWEIYVMNADGTNPINLTQNRAWDLNPSWGLTPTLSVFPERQLATLWGKVKGTGTYLSLIHI